VAASQTPLSTELRRSLATEELLLPPLRERLEDLKPLAAALTRGWNPALSLPAAGLALLERYAWPGNVRELRNVLCRVALVGSWDPEWLGLVPEYERPVSPASALLNLTYGAARRQAALQFERRYFGALLSERGVNRRSLEERTGLSTPSLYRLLKRTGLRLEPLKNRPRA
jgi:DNA-binding NtrC family response regulator